MSWELMSSEESPCKCGKGKLITELYGDDWNRFETRYRLECPDCSEKYSVIEVCDGGKPYHERHHIEYVPKK